MGQESRTVVGARAGTRAAASFDVICAGEALWNLAGPGDAFSARPAALRLRPGGGAVNVAVALARSGLRVGLAPALADDAFNRALLARVAAEGVDVGSVGGVAGAGVAAPRAGLVFVDETFASSQVVSYREEDEQPAAVPATWAAQVLLLSGLSPAVAHAGALCKAARSARRAGSIVVVDVNARRRLWAGQDSRAICMVVREADVVRCSTEDLAVLRMDLATIRAAMRRTAVLVVTDGIHPARVTGAFGEVTQAPRVLAPLRPAGAGDAFTAAICAELARVGPPGIERMEVWERALQRGHAAASARIRH